jgi:hypothetical protein
MSGGCFFPSCTGDDQNCTPDIFLGRVSPECELGLLAALPRPYGFSVVRLDRCSGYRKRSNTIRACRFVKRVF